ncbi:hypothetical protein R5W60_21485 (plasmid) [Brucella pseudintermedia]|uniref:Uncharacterized protein n=1 Tax=Brucella intermedia TaxID=94625 RepID=A0A7V6TYB3_9HYPH|nr:MULTISPECIES: hypothetical protein [Brucella]WPM83136.1 hypothetical protein R5W60_21485 [Brucella pseudintermedia]HHV66741.1 hypothetical protein [Brucella intermedia]
MYDWLQFVVIVRGAELAIARLDIADRTFALFRAERDSVMMHWAISFVPGLNPYVAQRFEKYAVCCSCDAVANHAGDSAIPTPPFWHADKASIEARNTILFMDYPKIY